jgi:signal transduction histidine kinase
LGSSELRPRGLTILVIAGLNAGAARSLAPAPFASSIYAGVALPLVFVRFVAGQEVGSWTLAWGTALYVVLLIKTAQMQRQEMKQLHRLNFENEALVSTLSDEKENAENANRGKSEVLAVMSHEIRTLMNGVIGMLDILKYSELTPAQAEQVEVPTSSDDSLLRLLNDILELSRIESGRLQFEQTKVDPAQLVQEVGDLFRISGN